MSFDKNEHEDAGAPTVIDPSIEREAREMGWAPKDQWRGKPEDFVEADEFVERGRRILPVVRSQFEKARAENARLKRELEERTADFERRFGETTSQLTRRLEESAADFERRIKASEAMARRSLELQRTDLVSRFEAEKRAAAASGDTEAYDAIARREQETYRRVAEEDSRFQQAAQPTVDAPAPRPIVAQEPKAAKSPPVPPEVEEFSSRNPWFKTDENMRLEAIALHGQILQDSPYMPLADNLAEVERQIKQRHAAKFGIKRQEQTESAPKVARTSYQSVEGGNASRASASPKQFGFKELPPEAKAACEELISRNLLRGEKAKENYAREYWAEYGE